MLCLLSAFVFLLLLSIWPLSGTKKRRQSRSIKAKQSAICENINNITILPYVPYFHQQQAVKRACHMEKHLRFVSTEHEECVWVTLFVCQGPICGLHLGLQIPSRSLWTIKTGLFYWAHAKANVLAVFDSHRTAIVQTYYRTRCIAVD